MIMTLHKEIVDEALMMSSLFGAARDNADSGEDEDGLAHEDQLIDDEEEEIDDDAGLEEVDDEENEENEVDEAATADAD